MLFVRTSNTFGQGMYVRFLKWWRLSNHKPLAHSLCPHFDWLHFYNLNVLAQLLGCIPYFQPLIHVVPTRAKQCNPIQLWAVQTDWKSITSVLHVRPKKGSWNYLCLMLTEPVWHTTLILFCELYQQELGKSVGMGCIFAHDSNALFSFIFFVICLCPSLFSW